MKRMLSGDINLDRRYYEVLSTIKVGEYLNNKEEGVLDSAFLWSSVKCDGVDWAGFSLGQIVWTQEAHNAINDIYSFLIPLDKMNIEDWL